MIRVGNMTEEERLAARDNYRKMKEDDPLTFWRMARLGIIKSIQNRFLEYHSELHAHYILLTQDLGYTEEEANALLVDVQDFLSKKYIESIEKAKAEEEVLKNGQPTKVQ